MRRRGAPNPAVDPVPRRLRRPVYRPRSSVDWSAGVPLATSPERPPSAGPRGASTALQFRPSIPFLERDESARLVRRLVLLVYGSVPTTARSRRDAVRRCRGCEQLHQRDTCASPSRGFPAGRQFPRPSGFVPAGPPVSLLRGAARRQGLEVAYAAVRSRVFVNSIRLRITANGTAAFTCSEATNAPITAPGCPAPDVGRIGGKGVLKIRAWHPIIR